MKEREEKRAAWQARLEALAKSGLTQREFCAREGLSLDQLGYWRMRLAPSPMTTPWCSVDFRPETNDAGHALTVRVGVACVEVQPGFDATLLRDVVRALAPIVEASGC